jgi:hypothetical protein
MDNNFSVINTVKFWGQKVLPTVYDDSLSYEEQLTKLQTVLNQVITNNNLIPDYLKQLIEEFISSGIFGEVVSDMIGNFILNVKYPPNSLTPAKGDGTTDDTVALQGCINYANANGGKCVYIPNGVYLSQPLTLKDNVSLCGAGRYNSRIVLKGGATLPLINGNPVNCEI